MKMIRIVLFVFMVTFCLTLSIRKCTICFWKTLRFFLKRKSFLSGSFKLFYSPSSSPCALIKTSRDDSLRYNRKVFLSFSSSQLLIFLLEVNPENISMFLIHIERQQFKLTAYGYSCYYSEIC